MHLERCARGLQGTGASAQWMARQELRGALWGHEKRAGDGGIDSKHRARSFVSEPLFRFRIDFALLYQRSYIASDRYVRGTARRGRAINVATSRAQCASRRGAARGGQWQRGAPGR